MPAFLVQKRQSTFRHFRGGSLRFTYDLGLGKGGLTGRQQANACRLQCNRAKTGRVLESVSNTPATMLQTIVCCRKPD